GISGASKLRKGELVNAITENQGADSGAEAAPQAEDAAVAAPETIEAPAEAAPEVAADAAAETVPVRKRGSRRVTSADTAAIAAAPVLAGAPIVDLLEVPVERRQPKGAISQADLGIELPEGPTGHTPA